MLIEHGFHTNKAEVELLKKDAYRALLAEADAKGILDYLGISWEDNPATEPEADVGGICCPHCGKSLKIVKG